MAPAVAWLALALVCLLPASAQTTRSAQLNGSGSFALPALPAMSGSFTLEAWIYARSNGAWSKVIDIGSGSSSNNLLLMLGDGTSVSKPSFWVASGTTPVGHLISPSAIPLNAWVHIACVLESATLMRLYINGTEVGTLTTTVPVGAATRNSSFIGKSNWTDPIFDGSVADVRFWNVARTAAQIQGSMAVGAISGATTGLVAAYPFGATGQAALNDVSGNNRTLTPSGTIQYQTAGPSNPLGSVPDDVIAAELNAAGSFTLNSTPALSGDITLEGWVLPKSHANWARIVDVGTELNKIMLLASSTTTGRPVLYVDMGGGNVLNLAAPNPIPLNAWSHVAGVLKSDRSAQLYVNGQLVASGTASQAFSATSGMTGFVGASRNPADVLLNGSIADVRIWNSARTQAQIQAAMPVGSVTGPATGLLAAYPFSNTGRPALDDISGNNRGLTQVGTVQFKSTAPAPSRTSSAWLNGEGSFSIPSLPAMGGDMTVEAWVRPTRFQAYQRIVDLGRGQQSDNIVLLSCGDSSAIPGFALFSGSTDIVSIASPTAIPLDAWTHVAGVFSSSDGLATLYINGQPVATGTASGPLPSVARTSNLIGKSNWSGEPTASGSIADVRVWNTRRTQAEIQAGMTVGSISGSTTGLVAAYPFGATGGSVFADVSGNNRTLTSAGSVQFDLLGPSSPTSAPSDATVAVDLKGTSYFNMPEIAAWNVFTVEAWVNPRSFKGFGRVVDLGNAGYPNDNLLLMYADGNTTKPVFWVFYGTDSTFSYITAPNPIPLNTWSHIAGTIDAAGVMRLFVNGVQVATATAPKPANVVARSSSRIGANHDFSSILDGSIADVRIWNLVRTEAQIRASMPAGSLSGPVTGLMRGYTFGATGGNALASITGSAVDLTQVGSPEFIKTGSGLLSAGSFQGTASVSIPSGQLTLLGASAHSGSTTVASGSTLQVGNGGASGALGTGSVVNQGRVVFHRSGFGTVANTVSGSGSLTLRGGASLAFTGANTYSGGTTVEGSSFQVGDGGTSGSLGSGNVVLSGTSSVVFNRSDDITVGNVISGTGSVSKYGSGRTTLTASQSYTGTTTVGAGTLALSGVGSLGQGGITVVSGATLDASGRSSALVLGASQPLGNMSGTGSLVGPIDLSNGALAVIPYGSSAPLSVTGGNVTLSASTSVKVNKLSTPYAAGLYKILGKSGAGAVVGEAPSAIVVEGAGVGAGMNTAALLSGSELSIKVATPATVTLGSLAHAYDGSPKSATATTVPSGLSVAITYNGSANLPVNGGSYAVTATITDNSYSGSASGTLVISKGAATLQLGGLQQSYDGTARRVIVTTTPPGLAWSATYNGNANAPTNVGSYPVVVSINDVNYAGSITGTLVVKPGNPGTRPAATPNPPSHLNHQGFLSDASGNPLGSPNPRNYELIFRIFASPLGGSSIWAERQTVLLDQGRYSVMLGEGYSNGVEPWAALDDVLASGAGSERYLEVSVRGTGLGGSDVTMLPRLRIGSQPYAFLARHALSADTLVGSNGVPVLRVAGSSIGINVEQPNAGLDVGGTLTATTLSTPGTATVRGVLTAGSFVGRGTIPLGGIVVWAGSTPPAGWALCDGQTAGGRKTPDLRGRFVLGQGNGTGLTARSIGQVGGVETHTLTLQQIPAHTHVFDPPAADTSAAGAHSHGYWSHAVGAGLWPYSVGSLPSGYSGTHHGEAALPDTTTHKHPVSINATGAAVGGGQPHNAMPPYYVLAYIMRVQ